MLHDIFTLAKSDHIVAKLLDEVREYAHIYLLAKQRQKGCNGMGELVSLREEFRDSIDKTLNYCKEKHHIDVFTFDIDVIAEDIKQFP